MELFSLNSTNDSTGLKNDSVCLPGFVQHAQFDVLVYFVTVLTIIVSFPLNVSILWTVYSSGYLQKPSYLYIWNIALCDLVELTFSCGFQLLLVACVVRSSDAVPWKITVTCRISAP